MAQVQWKTRLELWIPGVPIPKGSYDAIPLGKWVGSGVGKRFVPFTRPNGVPIVNIVPNNDDALKPWVDTVTARAMEAWSGRAPLDEDVCVFYAFMFPRLKGHYGTGRNASTLKPSAPAFRNTKPDKDKLERAINDALTDAGVWKDDSRVVDGGSRKVYGPKPGARVWIQTIKETTA